ncbi:MAG: DUF2934 domain-containing protein [Candidatus Sulfotelmatobacter sp.]
MKHKDAQQPSDPPTQPLNLKNIEDLNWQLQQAQLAIARRAYELFEQRGGEHGHAWEDWFRAESELLCPVSVVMSESDDRISIRANVFGFDETELNVAVEPRRVTILGKKQLRLGESKESEYIDQHPDQLIKFIDLGTDVMPESARVELQAGVIKCELPKAGKRTVKDVAAAA